jgi:hypothetical protein
MTRVIVKVSSLKKLAFSKARIALSAQRIEQRAKGMAHSAESEANRLRGFHFSVN